LKREPDGEHDGDGKQPLCEPCDDICFIDDVHDVLRVAFGSDEGQIAPRSDLEQTQCLTAD
jgi:hypothetical protein